MTVTVKMQLTVHSKECCIHDIFRYMARIVILSSNSRKSNILTIFFCNFEIPVLGCRQSRDSVLAKTVGILGLQSLLIICCLLCSLVLRWCVNWIVSSGRNRSSGWILSDASAASTAAAASHSSHGSTSCQRWWNATSPATEI